MAEQPLIIPAQNYGLLLDVKGPVIYEGPPKLAVLIGPIHSAANNMHDNPLAVEAVLKIMGQDVNEIDEMWGWTALMYAVAERNVNIVRSLLQNYLANVQIADRHKTTALHMAVEWDSNPSRNRKLPEIVELLLLHGAPVDIADEDGETPLLLTLRSFINLRIVGWLLNRGANANERNKNGRTCLHIVSYNRKQKFKALTFIELMRAGASLSERDEDGLDILHSIANSWEINLEYKLKILKDLVRSHIVVNYFGPIDRSIYRLCREKIADQEFEDSTFQEIEVFAERCYEEVHRMHAYRMPGPQIVILREFVRSGYENEGIYNQIVTRFKDGVCYWLFSDCIAARMGRVYLKRTLKALTIHTRVGQENVIFEEERVLELCKYLSDVDLFRLIIVMKRNPLFDPLF